MQFVNNIIFGMAGQAAIYCEHSTSLNPPDFRFNNVFAPSGTAYGGTCNDQTGTNGNISSDPLFVDQSGSNYRLQPASQSIDVGDSTAPGIPSRDLDGNARILDGRGSGTAVIDLGAYERVTVLTPGSHDFGGVDLGAASASMAFRISNPGASTLAIGSISIANRTIGAGGPPDFAVAAGGPEPCPSLAPSLLSGQSCTVLVTFTTPATLGRKGATLSVASNIGGSPTVAALLAEVVVDTSITSSLPERSVSHSASFTFAANAGGSTFECKLDTEVAFSACTSRRNYASLGLGQHTFQVRAVSKFGDADPTPASRTWTIEH